MKSKKVIWILTHHASPPQFETRIRNNAMAKYLIKAGYDVTIFGASTIHNTDINLIEDGSLYIEKQYGDLKYIHVNAPMYKGNGIERIMNYCCYSHNLYQAVKKLDRRPDVIINDLDITSFNTPFKISKYTGAPIITEVRDLWPESIIVYGYLRRNTLLAKYLYHREKILYMRSDHIVHTMQGWYDYIRERGWTKNIKDDKATYINNGLDLDLFNYNREHFQVQDKDLDNPNIFKVVYTGSIRRVNNLGKLLDIAREVNNKKIKFLIWGNGDELECLKTRVSEEKIQNVIFKGVVEKKYVPYIVSKADLNIAHNTPTELFRFGISFNKIFDYLAAGKPILSDFPCKYNPTVIANAGIECSSGEPRIVAEAIEKFCSINTSEYNEYCENAKKASHEYDFKNLTNKMIKIIESFD